MTTWLVTGAAGFVGSHVLDAIRAAEPGARVVRLVRPGSVVAGSSGVIHADLESAGAWQDRVAGLRPDFVIHAAGRTPPAAAVALYRGNVAATAYLLDALRRSGGPVRVVHVGSAAELGPVPTDQLPIDEDRLCRPADAYGLSKWAATRLGLDANGRDRLEVIVARPFNPIGPGQPPSQAFGRLARRLLRARDGEHLPVGDVTARRDFVDVRDVGRSLVALARAGRAGRIYHVGTGVSRTVGEGFACLLAESGRRIVLVPAAGAAPRPADSRASIERISADTGWRPSISFERSLRDLWASAGAARDVA